MSQATIRRARLDDHEGACRLLDALDAWHGDRLPWLLTASSGRTRSEAFLAELLAREDSAVFVADAGHVVGVAVGRMRAAPGLPVFIPQRWGVLDALVVDPDWRRRGIGGLLARAVEVWAIGLGAPWVEVNVYEVNDEARRFYEASGYLPLSAKLRKAGPGHEDAGIRIRREQPGDTGAIGALIRAAFLGMPYAEGDEAELVDALRAEGALSVSLVAERAGTIVGHVAFSPASPPGGAPGWYALGPLAVLPAHQRGGIGSALVRAGLDAIAGLGAHGCILTGDPSYYSRFGFALSPGNTPRGQPPEFFMVKLLRGRLPEGPIRFHEAFGGGA